MKPKIIQSAQSALDNAKSALDEFKNQAAKIQAERAETAAEIEARKAEIKRLKGLPICRDDFSLLLKEHIAAQAEQAEQNLAHALTDVKKDFHDNIEHDQYPKRSMEKLEVKRNANGADWLFSGFQVAGGGSVLSIASLENPRRQLEQLCWLLPEVIHDKIMAVADNTIGAKWGNEELPRVAARRETIIDLENEIEQLQTRLQELDEAIANFKGVTSEPLTAKQRFIMVHYPD